MLWVLFPFYMGTYLMHWVHRIEDTDALDIVGYYYLFNSPKVRTQYNKGQYQCGYEKENTEDEEVNKDSVDPSESSHLPNIKKTWHTSPLMAPEGSHFLYYHKKGQIRV